MKLTSQQVDALTLPPGKFDVLYFDDDVPGLALRLRAGGTRNWIFQYRHGHQQRRITIGAARALTPAEARRRASRLHAEVKLGGDPAGAKAKARQQADQTFGALLPTFLARQRERLRPKSYLGVQRDLEVHAERLHAVPMSCDPLEARRAIATVLTMTAANLSGRSANKLRSSLSGFYAWAIKQGLADVNPASFTERRPQSSRRRVLDDEEIREIWTALGDDAYGDVVRILLLTGARAAEIGALRWVEVDLDEASIALPPQRVKNNRERFIVLNDLAVAILRRRCDARTGDMVFARTARGFSDWYRNKVDLDSRILAARRAAAWAAGEGSDKVEPLRPWVHHDFRRVISTVMHERLGIAPHIVEAVLGHVGHQRGVAGVYNKARYLVEMRRALETWAGHLLAVVEGRESKVVSLPKRA
jgi:integrase